VKIASIKALARPRRSPVRPGTTQCACVRVCAGQPGGPADGRPGPGRGAAPDAEPARAMLPPTCLVRQLLHGDGEPDAD
jgi:hypothetical protein